MMTISEYIIKKIDLENQMNKLDSSLIFLKKYVFIMFLENELIHQKHHLISLKA